MYVIISNNKYKIRNESIAVGDSSTFFRSFQLASIQEHKRNPEIHLWLLILLCKPKIFSGPVWTAELKISGSAND